MIKYFSIVILLTALSLLVPLALADSPPAWENFEITSSNNKYIASIRADTKEDNSQPWESLWKLTIYKIDVEHKKLTEQWTSDYMCDGYTEGWLSNDGSIFVYINQWYKHDAPIIKIYNKNDKPRFFMGKEFKIPLEKLKNTASHKLWLSQRDYPYIFHEWDSPTLGIYTIDNMYHLIDLEAGTITSSKIK